MLQRSSEPPACATPERPFHFFVVCATFVALTRATRRTNWMAMNMPTSSAIVRGAHVIFVVNPLKLGVDGDLPKIRNLNQQCVQKV
jgi:hypothetical protein